MMKRPKVTDIDTQFQKLCANGTRDIEAYNKLLKLCELYDKKATEIFNEIVKKKIRPNTTTYNFLLCAYMHGNRLSKFDDLWPEILERDNDLLFTFYVKFYNCYIKDNIYYERIMQIYHKFMIHSNIYYKLGFELLMAFNSNIDKKHKLLSRILSNVNSLDTYIFHKLFIICYDNKYLIFNSLFNSSKRPDEKLYEKMLTIFRGDDKILIKLFEMIDRYKSTLTNNLVNLLIILRILTKFVN